MCSFICMATDNVLQGMIAVCIFGISIHLSKKYNVEVSEELRKFGRIVEKIITRK